MNCANHPDAPRAAFCRTCGKALCADCRRTVRGVIYCENCLAARLEGTLPPPSAPLPAGPRTVPLLPVAGPNPPLAGILAGIFPFGVGAVYTGQYAKGLAHLVIFVALIWGLSADVNSGLEVALAIALGFFCIYQIIDAIRSARAVQMGQPAPDPFGLSQTFGTGEKLDTSKVPLGAVVLIGIGALFLLQTLEVPFFNVSRIWPLFLIALGVWLFARRQGVAGTQPGRCVGPLGQRGMAGPVVLVTLGVLFLIGAFNGPDFGRTWPVLLLAIGLAKLLEDKTPRGGPPPEPGGVPPAPGTGSAPTPSEIPQTPSSSSEVRNG